MTHAEELLGWRHLASLDGDLLDGSLLKWEPTLTLKEKERFFFWSKKKKKDKKRVYVLINGPKPIGCLLIRD